MLVVHDVPLVAGDLREMLMSVGATDVELAKSLPEEVPPERFDTCFLSVPSRSALDAQFLARAASLAAHVVLIMGFLQKPPELPPQFSILSEPFRDEDIRVALRAARGGGVHPA